MRFFDLLSRNGTDLGAGGTASVHARNRIINEAFSQLLGEKADVSEAARLLYELSEQIDDVRDMSGLLDQPRFYDWEREKHAAALAGFDDAVLSDQTAFERKRGEVLSQAFSQDCRDGVDIQTGARTLILLHKYIEDMRPEYAETQPAARSEPAPQPVETRAASSADAATDDRTDQNGWGFLSSSLVMLFIAAGIPGLAGMFMLYGLPTPIEREPTWTMAAITIASIVAGIVSWFFTRKKPEGLEYMAFAALIAGIFSSGFFVVQSPDIARRIIERNLGEGFAELVRRDKADQLSAQSATTNGQTASTTATRNTSEAKPQVATISRAPEKYYSAVMHLAVDESELEIGVRRKFSDQINVTTVGVAEFFQVTKAQDCVRWGSYIVFEEFEADPDAYSKYPQVYDNQRKALVGNGPTIGNNSVYASTFKQVLDAAREFETNESRKTYWYLQQAIDNASNGACGGQTREPRYTIPIGRQK